MTVHPTLYANVAVRVQTALAGLEERRREYFGEHADARWVITSRVKTAASIAAKLERKRRQGKAGYDTADLTDVVGVRVVVEGRACAAQVATFMRAMFPTREADCEDFLDTPRGDGYRGIHLILDVVPDAATRAPIPVELQIRTILQHQWSVLSHSEFYKQVAEIPQSMLLRMRALSEILNCAEIESDQLRRSRISDECSRTLRDLLVDTVERLSQRPDHAEQLGNLGLHLLEFDRKLRRTLVSTGDRERRAFGALESLADPREVPGGDLGVAQQLIAIVKRVRIVVMPCYPEPIGVTPTAVRTAEGSGPVSCAIPGPDAASRAPPVDRWPGSPGSLPERANRSTALPGPGRPARRTTRQVRAAR
ncbi:MAG TPA: RelA/SpoT domain-containing protein [Kofleriaceae bacterium]|nr:RelA/SpoT domain-containing protein [Kofleriaceae bacterium]